MAPSVFDMSNGCERCSFLTANGVRFLAAATLTGPDLWFGIFLPFVVDLGALDVLLSLRGTGDVEFRIRRRRMPGDLCTCEYM